jgi:lysophospholipase L1-like esterase
VIRAGLRFLWRWARRAAFLVLAVELACFLVVTVLNMAIYGRTREGSRVVYDSCTLYASASGQRVTLNNKVSADAKQNRRIWFFGGSTTRNNEAEDGRTLPSLVARMLNAEGPESFTCENFAENSFTSLQDLRALQKALVERDERPDCIVFLDGANDASYFSLYRSVDAHEGYDKVRGLVESYWQSPLGLLKPLTAAYYASFTRELALRLIYAFAPLDPDSPLLAGLARAMGRRYDYAAETARGLGAGLVVFLQPLYWVEPPRPEIPEQELAARAGRFPGVRRNFALVYDAVEPVLAGRPYFVNLRHVLEQRDFPAYLPDGIHNTDQGREVLARAMLPGIRRALARAEAR